MYDGLRIEIREYAEGIQREYDHPDSGAQSVCTRPFLLLPSKGPGDEARLTHAQALAG